MELTRREVFRLMTAAASGLALSGGTARLARAITRASPPPVVWVNHGGEALSLLTLMGRDVPGFSELVALEWNLQQHADVLPAGYSPPKEVETGAPVVVLETLPDPEALQTEEMGPLATRLARAKTAVLLGTDACFGGLRYTPEQVQRVEDVCRELQTPLIKLPGVPPPPHHLVGVLAHLEFFGFPRLDAHLRPLLYYGRTVCETCERRKDLETGRFAAAFGEDGCLLQLGCKGLFTHNTCSEQRWNSGVNWCVGAGGPCTGCSEPGYPLHAGLGLYGAPSGERPGGPLRLWQHVERAGYGLLGIAVAGMGLQLARRWLAPGRDRADPPGPPEAG